MRKPVWLYLLFVLRGVAFSQWKLQRSDLKVEFRGLSVTNERVAWASGSRNTYARTTHGGMHWAMYDTQGFHEFAFARSKPVGWAAGAGGRIAVFRPILESTITR
jgi:hypothetical protein